MEWQAQSPEEMERLGRQVATELRAGGVVALVGGLGAGKTHWTKGLVAGLGCPAEVTSPTFGLVHEYRGGSLVVRHLDFYRLDHFICLGFYLQASPQRRGRLQRQDAARMALLARACHRGWRMSPRQPSSRDRLAMESRPLDLRRGHRRSVGPAEVVERSGDSAEVEIAPS